MAKYTVGTAESLSGHEKDHLLHDLTGGFRASRCGIGGFGFYSRLTQAEIFTRLANEKRDLCLACWSKKAAFRYRAQHPEYADAAPSGNAERDYAKGELRTLAMLCALKGAMETAQASEADRPAVIARVAKRNKAVSEILQEAQK